MADKKRSFTEEAKDRQPGLFAEIVHYAAHNKKWWLTPILVLLLLLSVLILLGGSGAAPFIYSLF